MTNHRPCPPFRSTYRLQLHAGFGLDAVRALIPHLHRLGISHLYLSPVFRASPGSQHGYDVLDHNQVNPELGGLGALYSLAEEAASRGMGLLLDFVPNHVGLANGRNPWWQDVLRHGPRSPFAQYFDIDWEAQPQMASGVVVYPILGAPFGVALESGELKLGLEENDIVVCYYDNHLPVRPESYAMVVGIPPLELAGDMHSPSSVPELVDILDSLPTAAREQSELHLDRFRALLSEEPALARFVAERVEALNGEPGVPESFDRLESLLMSQHYRLAYWRIAGEELNYRRFFDVNSLAAIRVERDEVFAHIHALLFELVSSGVACGLRLDHIDGLYDPATYLHRLRTVCDHQRPDAPFHIYVEKILAHDERLPPTWPIDGTTGYEFMSRVDGLLVDPSAEEAMTETYTRFLGNRVRYRRMVYDAKHEIAGSSFAGEITVLAMQAHRIGQRHRKYRDITMRSLRRAITGILACFNVYRTYIVEGVSGDKDRDRQRIRQAINEAAARDHSLQQEALQFLERVLLLEVEDLGPDDTARCVHFRRRFQQVSGPVMAKSFEDTLFYRYNRLISLNEVGSEPDRFGIDPAELHDWFTDRAERWPAALSASSTHDTKLSEDSRARLHVLSEVPGRWRTEVSHWQRLNSRWRTSLGAESAPDANTEYRLYQALVGTWPEGGPNGEYRERMAAHLEKAMREAKENTSWTRVNSEYEAASQAFLAAILDRRKSSGFLRRISAFVASIRPAGERNALAALALKCLAPGIPDFYQGTEVPFFALADPDNRRQPDFAKIEQLSKEICRDGERTGRSGHARAKLWLTHRLLELRNQRPDLLSRGRYEPLQVSGPRAAHVFAFAREHAGRYLVAAVPRLTMKLQDESGSIAPGAWDGTVVHLPNVAEWRNELTGCCTAAKGEVACADLFGEFPVGVLTGGGG